MNLKITPKRIIAFYFLAPYILGVLLADGLGIDISGVMKEIFGLLHDIELAGESTNVKAMSLLWMILLGPIVYRGYKPELKNGAKDISGSDISSLKLIFFIIFAIAFLAVFYYLYIVGFNIVEYVQERQYINPSMRLFLKVCSSDFLFSVFTAFLVVFEFFIVLAMCRLIGALWLRFT
jgi:hypothetical protein